MYADMYLRAVSDIEDRRGVGQYGAKEVSCWANVPGRRVHES
jgi:hypothetical protein